MKFNIADLIAAMPDEPRAEIDWGPAVGREFPKYEVVPGGIKRDGEPSGAGARARARLERYRAAQRAPVELPMPPYRFQAEDHSGGLAVSSPKRIDPG